MRPRSAMYAYQQAGVACAVERKRLAALLDVGEGKTVIGLTALVDRLAFPALVVAPALVVETDVWGEEARAWEHLDGLRVLPVRGSAERRMRLLSTNADVYVVSYENLVSLTDMVAPQSFKAIVFDELSKMKTPGTKRGRRMRAKNQLAIPFRLGATGNPVPNHLLDLWGELSVIAPKSMGETFSGFRDTFFEPADYEQRVYRLRGMRCPRCRGAPTRCGNGCKRPYIATAESRRHERAVWKLAKPHVYVRSGGALAGVPPLRFIPHRLSMPAETKRISEQLRRQLWASLPSGAALEALSSSAVAMKVRQLAGGAVYLHPDAAELEDAGVVGKWEAVHDAKLRALRDLVDELQGEPVLVFYWFDHERIRLQRLFPEARLATERDAVAAWNARDVPVLLAHPQSAGMGVNLQGGGHHIVWFTLPWAWWQFNQGNGRLARLGQTYPEVYVHLLLCGPVDDDVREVLTAKEDTERRFKEAMQ